MASNFDDPTQWRLTTVGGIRYKWLSIDGEFGEEEATAQVKVLVEASSLLNFMLEMLPPPVQIGNISIPQGSTLPGFPQMAVRKVSFQSFDGSMPIDPFGFDPSPPDGTYFPVVQCTIHYDSRIKKRDTDENDPLTFLEISSSASGEFLHTNAPKSRWQVQENSVLGDGDDEADGGWIDAATNRLNGSNTDTDEEVNRDPSAPVTIQVPLTEWTIRWPQVPFTLYRDVMVHRLRQMLGRVNKSEFNVPLLSTLERETLLCVSHAHNEQHTWRDGLVSTPPVSVEIKLLEKRIVWNGVVCGHNHFWRPGHGWQLLYLNENQDRVYKQWDFNILLTI